VLFMVTSRLIMRVGKLRVELQACLLVAMYAVLPIVPCVLFYSGRNGDKHSPQLAALEITRQVGEPPGSGWAAPVIWDSVRS